MVLTSRAFLRDLTITVVVIGIGAALFWSRAPSTAPVSVAPTTATPPAPVGTTVPPVPTPTVSLPIFIRSLATRGDLAGITFADLPAFSDILQVVPYRDEVIVVGFLGENYLPLPHGDTHVRRLLRYRRSDGRLLAVSNPDAFRCAVVDAAVIGETLYAACAQQGITAVDLRTERIIRSFSTDDGLPRTDGLQLVADGGQLWVATFDGLARIDVRSGSVRSYSERELPGVGGKPHGTRVYARHGEVWAAEPNSLHPVAAGYDRVHDAWVTYELEDFQPINQAAAHLGAELFVSDVGVFAAFQEIVPAESSTVTLFRFDRAEDDVRGRWTALRRVRRDRNEPFEDLRTTFYPPRSTYATYEILPDGIALYDRDKHTVVPIRPRYYAAMTAPIDGTRYLLSSLGIEALHAGEPLPTLVAPAEFGFSDIDLATTVLLLVSSDQRFIVIVSGKLRTIDREVILVDIGLFDRRRGSLVMKRFLPPLEVRSTFGPPFRGLFLDEEDRRVVATLREAGDQFTIQANGQPVITINRKTGAIVPVRPRTNR